MQPLEITRAEAREILKAAYAAGTLAAQQPEPIATYYDSRSGGRCAIGHLYPVKDAKALEKGPFYKMASGLINRGDLIVDDPDWFVAVQRTHDSWVNTQDPTPFLELLQ